MNAAETVDVYRGSVAQDEDGNPVRGPLSKTTTFNALIAPEQAAQSPSDTSQGVARQCTLYIRGDKPTGIQDTDRLVVRGLRMRPDGPVLEWADPSGRHIGDVIHCTSKEG